MNKLLMLVLIVMLLTMSASAQAIISSQYDNGWQTICYDDGKCAHSNAATYLRWDNVWIPAEWVNISNGNWSYTVVDAGTKMNFTADGKTISIPKANTKFNLELFKISPSLTYSKTALTNNMVNVNTTVAYLVFPYSLSQIRDYADEHNIKVGRWMFQAGQEHINIHDDVPVNHTFVNEAGQNETYLAVTTLSKDYYQFRIVNGEIRLYFLKAEANKLNGNITFALNSWTVGEGGNTWLHNSYFNAYMLDKNTNYIMLSPLITDELIIYYPLSGSLGNIAYDMNETSTYHGVNSTLINMNSGLDNGSSGWNSSGKYGNSIAFDGIDDYTRTERNIGAFGLHPRSISFWFKPFDKQGRQELISIGTKNPGEPSLFSIAFDLTDEKLYFVCGVYPTCDFAGNSVITRNVWNHAVLTFNGTQTKLYVNGILDAYKDNSPNIGDSVLTIGADMELYPGMDYYFKGQIDDVYYYWREINVTEINLVMNHTLKTSENITVWHDSGTGNETYQVGVNATSQANSNYTVWYANNATGSYSQLGGTLTGNNSLPITTKYQNTDIQVRLAGNTTSTPEIISITFWTKTLLDTSFTVSLPSGITQAFFNATNKSSKNVNASGQNVTAGFLYITNTGNVALDFYAVINSSQPAGVALKGSTDNNPAGESVVPIDDSLVKIIDAIPVSESQYFWLWVDYSNASPMAEQRLLSVNSSQS